MSNNANVVPVIDNSASMSYNGYVDITKRDASAFISYARPGDGFGIVTFDTNGKIVDPTSGTNLVTVDANLSVLANAAKIINKLPFNGNKTNIGAGIVSAKSLLNSAAAPKAMVLLSDGYHNYGTPPLTVLPNYPIYTCAMGNNADKALLKKIAEQTGGNPYVAPYPSTMMMIFNEIRGLPANVHSVQNVQSHIASQSYKMVPATFSNNNLSGQFGVVWDDNQAQWTSSPSPGVNQISVTLVQPNGSLLKQPAITGKGYAVFNQPAPNSGLWYIQIIAGSLSQTLIITSGAFEFPQNPSKAISLNLKAPHSIKAGESLNVKAHITDGDEPVSGLKLTARIEQPSTTKEEILKKHESELYAIDLQKEDLPDHLSEEDKRITVLRAKLLPKKDIMGPRQYPVVLKANEKNLEKLHTTTIKDTLKSGGYNVHVTVTGHSEVTNTPFQRSKIVSVYVE